MSFAHATSNLRLPARSWPVLVVALALWLGALGVTLPVLWSYESAPGEGAGAPARWPSDSRIPLDRTRPTLLVFLHPRCPCSRATATELERLLASTLAPPAVRA